MDEPIKIELAEVTEPVVDRFPTEKEAIEAGELSPEEIALAKESNLLSGGEQSDDDKSKDDGDKDKKAEGKEGQEDKDDGKDSQAGEKDSKKGEDLSEEDEYKKLQSYSNNEKGLYWKQKKERRKRQEAERLRDEAVTRTRLHEKRIEALKAQLDEIRSGKKGEKKPVDDGDIDLDELLNDNEDGKQKDADSQKDDKHYVTKEELELIEQKKNEEEAAKVERGKKLAAVLNEQEKEAKSYYKDFDAVTDLAKELFDDPEKFYKGDSRAMQKLSSMVQLMLSTAGKSMDTDQDYTAADIMYEIGQMHPKYKSGEIRKAGGDGKSAENGSGVERMLKNSQKRGSSAAVGSGGGKKFVSVDDITPEQAAILPQREFNKLPEHVQERVLKALG